MQTYATTKLLQSLGHRVSIINLNHPKTRFANLYHKGFSKNRVLKDIKFALFKRYKIGHFTKKMFSVKEDLIPKSDYTIVGSDQVWNRDITNPIDKAYYLGFVKGGKRIAFASSFGKFEWSGNEEEREYIKECFGQFEAISVREQSGVEICSTAFDVRATQVLDPTLCYPHYDKLIGRKKPYHEVFPFLLKNTSETNAICDMVSKRMVLPVYHASRVQNFLGMGPKEWLSRMKHSDYIITDSFHGLAFSLIFNKQFIVLCADDKKFARLRSLLKLVKLDDRYVESKEDLIARIDMINTPIDYSRVNSLLEREREYSISFLTNNIL